MQKAAIERNNETIAAQLTPVGRETVQDRVYSELRRALIGGLFEPNQVLTIRGLADALVTSTMPVREALGRLITEKALEALPNRSVRVPPITLERIDDLLRARSLIEGEAIALAAARMNPRVAERLDPTHDSERLSHGRRSWRTRSTSHRSSRAWTLGMYGAATNLM